MVKLQKKVFKKIRRFVSSLPRITVVVPNPNINRSKPSLLITKKIQQVLYYNYIIEKTKNIPGSFVECGVGHGRSLFLFASLLYSKNINRPIFAFDSFEGFPDIKEEDKIHKKAKKGYYKSNLDVVKKHLVNSGLPEVYIDKNIIFYKGYFENTLKKYNGGKIAILHIDCDLGQSYKEVLEQFYPVVISGGVIMFDEYRSREWKTATKVIDEFFKDKSEKIIKLELDQIKKYYTFKKDKLVTTISS